MHSDNLLRERQANATPLLLGGEKRNKGLFSDLWLHALAIIRNGDLYAAIREELVGRITEKIVFGRLDFDVQREICELMIARECERLHRLGSTVEVTPPAVEFLIRQGFHRTLGARPMRAAVERYLQDAVTAQLLQGERGSGRVEVAPTHDRLVLAPVFSDRTVQKS